MLLAGKRILVTGVLNDPEADCEEAPTSAAPNDQPAELSLADVVAAGRAAYCWLDVAVWLRNVTRHNGWDAGASTDDAPGH